MGGLARIAKRMRKMQLRTLVETRGAEEQEKAKGQGLNRKMRRMMMMEAIRKEASHPTIEEVKKGELKIIKEEK